MPQTRNRFAAITSTTIDTYFAPNLTIRHLTETRLGARAGIEPAHGPFLVRVLDAVVYPDMPEWLVVGSAVLVCVAILGVYVRRYLRRTTCGQW